jgi:hypothetical protein
LVSSVFGFLLLNRQAMAQAPSEDAIRFQYEAPGECPDVTAFTSRVRERTARGRLAEPDELARTFNVSITADTGGFSGSVAFLDDAGTNVSRRIRGEQCDEVVSSLALITALALDASLRSEAHSEPPPASPADAQRMRAAPTPELDAVSHRSPTRWAGGTAGGPTARIGVAGGYRWPIEAYGLHLLGQLDWGRRIGARLAAHYASADRNVPEGRRANLRLLGVEASLCAPWALSSTLLLHGCGAVDVGSLRARGLESPGLVSVSSDTILWVAVGAELRLAWEPDAPFWVELAGQLGVPLRSHRFIFEKPEVTVFEIGPDDPIGGLGVATGVRFW